MPSDDLEQVERLYHAALEQPESERGAFLEAACAGDDVLQREVAALLAYSGEAESFLQSGALAVAARDLIAEQSRSPLATLVGQIIARYRILEKVGGGGMGVVYKAQDTVLGRFVALKFLTESLAPFDPGSIERLKREARAASAIDHPNICTIHEIGEYEGRLFIVMQFLEGQTLQQRLAGHPLPLPEFRTVALAIADALDAAHAKGILHRDIKPANIFLTSRGEVKVLDFGLAKAIRGSEGAGPDIATTHSLTAAGMAIGTVPYMSPEQARGEELDARSDIFSFGDVLYEMTTGCPAFPGNTNAVVFNQLLSHAPVRPTVLNPELPPAVERIIDKALDKDRDRRYQTVALLRADLASLQDSATPAHPPRSGIPKFTMARATAIALALALLAIAVWYAVSRPVKRSSRPSVAVLHFRNLSGPANETWLATALPEMLTNQLAAGDAVRTIPGETVAQTMRDLSLPDAGSYSVETLGKIRRNLRADYVLLAEYLVQDGRLTLELTLQDARTGRIAAMRADGRADDLQDLVCRAGDQVRTKLKLDRVPQTVSNSARGAVPPSQEGAEAYFEGLANLRSYDAQGAIRLLEQEVKTDPGFAMAHAALAGAWARLGYANKAKEEAQTALALSQELPRKDRLAIEAGFDESNGKWDRAVNVYRRLWDLFPDDASYGLHLAGAQIKAGMAQAALTTLVALRKAPAADANDLAAADLTASQAAERLGDLKQAETSAAAAAQRAEEIGAGQLGADARAQECRLLLQLGRLDEARAACEKARQVYARAGDRNGEATVLGYLAGASRDEGNLTHAQELYNKALKIERDIGNDGGALWALNGLGDVLWSQGNLSAARQAFHQAYETCQRIGDPAGEADEVNDIANTWLDEGDLAKAHDGFEQALRRFRDLSEKASVAGVLNNLGEALYFQGDLNGAASALNEALQTDRQVGNQAELANEFSWLGTVRLAQANLEEARQDYDEAVGISREMGSPGYAAQYSLGLARVALEVGRAPDAERLIRQGLASFRRQKQRDLELQAGQLLARALLDEGKAADAREWIVGTAGLQRESQSRATRLEFAIVAARVRATAGDAAARRSLEDLKTVIAEAGRYGFRGYQMEGRLVSAEILREIHDAASASTTLEQVERDARQQGSTLIAQKASAQRGLR